MLGADLHTDKKNLKTVKRSSLIQLNILSQRHLAVTAPHH